MRKPNAKTCETCDFCQRVYRRSFFSHYISDDRYCTAHEIPIDQKNDACALWKRKRPHYDTSSERLNEAEDTLRFLLDLWKDL